MEILKTCKKHGKLTKNQIYYRKIDSFKRCIPCIRESSAKYLKRNKIILEPKVEKKDMAIHDFFAASMKFRDFSTLNHGKNIFYVDGEKFIANESHSYTRQVG